MGIVATLVQKAMKRLAAYLNQPCARQPPMVTTDVEELASLLRPGDVLLVEGKTRFAALVKYLTQSTWSHVAMYVGPLGDGPDPICIVEADIEGGVRGISLSEFRDMRVRVVRASGLTEVESAEVARRVASRMGQAYDLDCAVELARSLWPLNRGADRPRSDSAAPIPDTDRAICSTLLAQAFEEIGYPILPPATRAAVDLSLGLTTKPALARPVHTPRDFDLSPFFAVVTQPASRPVVLRPLADHSVVFSERRAAPARLSASVSAIRD